MSFQHFIAIDWSGAKAGYARKLQVAICEAGDESPTLMQNKGGWTRQAITDWLVQDIFPNQSALVGFDFSFAPPYLDHGSYLPGLVTGDDARSFWAYLDKACTDPDLGAAQFLEQHRGRYFYLGQADGAKAGFMRLRVCEQAFNASGGGKPSSVFDAIGAAQVAKASFAGMRVLHRLANAAPIWPFFAKPVAGSCVVEIYCRAFIRHAGLRGLKLRDLASLNTALAGLGCQPFVTTATLSDDMTDAIVAAAGLRRLADQAQFWHPTGLTPQIARVEGWTFGVP